MATIAALLTGYVLDLIFGDPHGFPHPVVGIGKLIALMERGLRAVFPATPRGELFAGVLLAALVPALCLGVVWALLWALGQVHVALRYAVESFLCYQILAVKSLKVESMKVYERLSAGDLPGARAAVSMIVGRDTDGLSAEGVAKAAVETVAENTSDGVIAPLLFMAIGGAPLGMLYKAVNTLDSMVGYKNERYLYLGRASAKLDDALNFLPSRIAGLAMVAAAYITGLNGRSAWRIFLRDRKNHASPNSAQTEAACAGALGVQLAGDASYFGKVVRKPTIGDAARPVEPEDIARADNLMMVASLLMLMLSLTLCGALRYGFYVAMGGMG